MELKLIPSILFIQYFPSTVSFLSLDVFFLSDNILLSHSNTFNQKYCQVFLRQQTTLD